MSTLTREELAAETGARLAELAADPARIDFAVGLVRDTLNGTIDALAANRSLRTSDKKTLAERARDYLAIVEAGAAGVRAAVRGAPSDAPVSEREVALRRYQGRAANAFRFMSSNIMRILPRDPTERGWMLDGYALAVAGLAAPREAGAA